MRRTFLLTLLSAFGIVSRALGQLAAKPPIFSGRNYAERPSDLKGEPELAAAVADLLEAAIRRDATLVEPWLDDEVYPIGGEEKKEWPKSRVLADMQTWDAGSWDAFGRSLRTGVLLDEEGVWAVAPFTAIDDMGMEEIAVIGEGVNVHLRAEASSPVLATVGYVILSIDRGEPRCEDSSDWVCIGTTEGARGFIELERVHSFGEEEIHFSRLPQGWRVVAWGAQSC